MTTFRSLVTAAVITLGGFATSQVQAHEPCVYKTFCTYENRTVPYQAQVTKYDHCGKPYYVTVTRYKTVTVPVHKVVKVCY